MLLQQQQNIEPQASTATHCPYCAFQCGMQISRTGQEISIAGDAAFPVNKGALCIKGWTAAATLAHPDRLTTPLARDANGALAPVSWDEAMERIVRGIEAAQSAYGKDSVGIFGGGSLTNEKSYLLGKLRGWHCKPPTSTTTGDSACHRRRRRASGRWALTGDCHSPWKTSPERTSS